MRKYYEIEQQTEEWFKLRIGSVGGSSIQAVCAKGQGKTRKTLMYRLAGEILSDEKYEGYTNDHMQRGIDQESEARKCYEFVYDTQTTQIGLVKMTDHKHYSPDAIVDDKGIIEIKCVIPSVHVETILQDKVPAAYRKQVQWGLHICEREWCKFISYSPLVKDRPLFVVHVERDEKLIKEMDTEADKFIEEMLEVVEKIKKG